MWRIGLDIGGTKIEALVIAPDGTESCRRRIPSPRGSYEATLHGITEFVAGLKAEFTIPHTDLMIGAGIPGSVSPRTALVRNANSTWLNGMPFQRDLEIRLGVPLYIENDANCLALSEAKDGAAAGASPVFAVILGTGVGGGLVVDGKVITGASGISGEWGHNPLPWPDESERPGPPCYCGKQGCIETFLSGPALERQYAEATGEQAGAHSIAARASAGDAAALAVLDTYARRLARALATVVNLIDPEVVVFAGGVSNIQGVVTAAREVLPNWVFADRCETVFRMNRWGDSSGVRGAAMLPLMQNSVGLSPTSVDDR